MPGIYLYLPGFVIFACDNYEDPKLMANPNPEGSQAACPGK